jgi:hypothetical protein
MGPAVVRAQRYVQPAVVYAKHRVRLFIRMQEVHCALGDGSIVS